MSINKSSPVKIQEILWRGMQPSWALTSDRFKLVLTKHGLNIASISLLNDDNNTNPFWVPHWLWTDPHYLPINNVPQAYASIYGDHAESQLLANICGHNICIDRFGHCKTTDIPRTCHGEGPITLFHKHGHVHNHNEVVFSADLPIAELKIERTFEIFDELSNVVVSTTLQSTSDDSIEKGHIRRDVEWCEHVTMGDPFLDGCLFDAPQCDIALNFGAEMPKSRWNKEYGPLDQLPSVSACLEMPALQESSIEIEECTALRCNASNDNNGNGIASFTARNERLGFELSYAFDENTFPWMAVWTEHFARKHLPWNGKERTRGMEFATKPLPMPELEKQECFADQIYKENGEMMFEGRNIEFALPPNGRTETFSFQWRKI